MTAADFAALFTPPGAPHLPGWCTPAKAAYLYGLARELARESPDPPAAVEIGVWGGRSLLPVAMAFRDAGRGFVLGIDPYTPEAATESEKGKNMEWWSQPSIDYNARWLNCCNLIASRNLARHCGLLRARSEDAAPLFDQLSYLHIDGNHAEPVAFRDASLFVPKVRAGGLIVMDDANWGSVKPARLLVAGSCTLVHAAEKNAWEVYRR